MKLCFISTLPSAFPSALAARDLRHRLRRAVVLAQDIFSRLPVKAMPNIAHPFRR